MLSSRFGDKLFVPDGCEGAGGGGGGGGGGHGPGGCNGGLGGVAWRLVFSTSQLCLFAFLINSSCILDFVIIVI